MSNYSTIRQFKTSIDDWIVSAEKAIEDVVKFTCEDILKDLVHASPVDTGRYKGNWQVTFNSMPLFALNNYDQSGGDTIATGLAQISKFAKGSGVTSIWFSNMLVYANALEYGHSMQAPNGVLGVVSTRLGFYVSDAINKARVR